ncbi:MAG TPA: GrpB family protein [Solirubrobacteraceae bacterium]
MQRDELEAHLDTVLIGGREQREVVIADYDPRWPQRFALERERIERAQRDVQMHVWNDDDPEIARYLAFRDRLRESPADRDEYERLKRSLAQREWSDINHYARAKGPLIEAILARAAGPDALGLYLACGFTERPRRLVKVIDDG